MLQIAPDAELDVEQDEKTDDAIYCARCGHLATRTRWALSMDGHEHVFFNPSGVVFRVVCFAEAPGIADEGQPTDEFSWFKGYFWNFALCKGCGEHMGWRFSGDADPQAFYGLIKNRLSSQPQAGDVEK